MALWQKVVRCVALALVLSAAFDLVVIDVSAPSLCAEGDDPSEGRQADPQQNSADNCFCCCTHVVPVRMVTFEPVGLIAWAPTATPAAEPASEPTAIYHAPKI